MIEKMGPAVPTGSVVIPAYNEEAVVATCLQRVGAELGALADGRDWEIVVVDDGSLDETAARAAAAAPAVEELGVCVRILRHAVNRGLGAAIQTAIGVSRGDVVVVLDCDLSYHPDHIGRLVDGLVSGRAQVAVASPYMVGGATIGVPRGIERRSRLANLFLARASHTSLRTLTGMVRAYDGPFVRALALMSVDDLINVEALYKVGVLRGRVVEVPATLDWTGLAARRERAGRRSGSVRAKTYQTVISGALFRPHMVFAAAGCALLAVGLLIGLVAAVLPGTQVGLTVLGVALVVCGVLGGLMSVLSMQVKRGFEEMYRLGSGARHHVADTTVYRAPAGRPDSTGVRT